MSVSIVADTTRRIIASKGLKHKVVARRAGFSEKQFSAILTGRRVIKDVDVAAIANALEVSPNVLFGLEREDSA